MQQRLLLWQPAQPTITLIQHNNECHSNRGKSTLASSTTTQLPLLYLPPLPPLCQPWSYRGLRGSPKKAYRLIVHLIGKSCASGYKNSWIARDCALAIQPLNDDWTTVIIVYWAA